MLTSKNGNEIDRFISRFQTTSPSKNIIEVFTCGCCYWFAHILCDRFSGAKMMYDCIENHFATEINGRLYDITGDVTGKYHVIPWSEFEDELEKERIIKYCVNFDE